MRKAGSATAKGSRMTVRSEVQEEKEFGIYSDNSGTVAERSCLEKVAVL